MDRIHRSLKTVPSKPPLELSPTMEVTVNEESPTHWILKSETPAAQFEWPKSVAHPALQLGTSWNLTLLPPQTAPSETEHLDSLRQLLQELIQ